MFSAFSNIGLMGGIANDCRFKPVQLERGIFIALNIKNCFKKYI